MGSTSTLQTISKGMDQEECCEPDLPCAGMARQSTKPTEVTLTFSSRIAPPLSSDQFLLKLHAPALLDCSPRLKPEHR